MRTVAVVPAIGLVAGCALGLLAPEVSGLPTRMVMVCCALGVCLAYWGERPRVLIVAATVGFMAGGAVLTADAWQHAWRPPLRLLFEQLDASAATAGGEAAGAGARSAARAGARSDTRAGTIDATVSGVLMSDAVATDGGVSLAIDVDSVEDHPAYPGGASRPAAGGVQATVSGVLAAAHVDQWRAGRRIRAPVQLRRPSFYLDPGVPNGERAMARRGVTLVGSIKSGALVELMGRGSFWAEAVSRTRRFARAAINRSVGRWSTQSAAIVSAIVIGDRAGLDQEMQRQLQRAGTYHVIAISGGNIAILAGLLLTTFKLAGLPSRVAMLVAIASLLAYADLAGGGASVERATCMAVLACGGRTLDHRSPPLNVLYAAVAALVVSSPLLVADTAFVLTCGATLAILIAAPLSMQRRRSRVLDSVVTLGMASLAVEVLLFPVGAIAFSRVTFAGLGLNFIAIPLMAVAQIAGMAVVPLAPVSRHLADAAGWIAHIGAAGLVWSAGLLRFAPGLAFRVAPPGWASVTIYYASLCLVWLGWRASRHRVQWVAAVAAAFSAVWILTAPWMFALSRGDGRLHVFFLDVGQGDSAFIRFPRGKTMLVDAGGILPATFDVGDRVVGPVLRGLGVRRLDILALSHGDPDHVGGAASVIRDFEPREVWEGIPVPGFAPLQALRTAAAEVHARWANVHTGDTVVLDDVTVTARHPFRADWERRRVRNDDSLVLELRWRDVRLVLAGDIGSPVESALIPAWRDQTRVRVLKVPHHGSLTSSTWPLLRTLTPQIAVVSAGRYNRFGHPAPEIVSRYETIGSSIFRTDQDGMVTLETDGHSLDVRGFTGRHMQVFADAVKK